MASINDNSALLLYRVGPVLCCAPCLPVSAIIAPPPLTRTPGSRPGHPGIFKHAHTIVTALDLRHQFGLDESRWANPGRSIVTTLDTQHIGFHVDEILDVISMPATGWGTLPALLPRGIFTRTLLHKERIFLYAEFAQLQHIPHSGYLRQYIQHLLASPPPETKTARPVPAAPMTKPVAPTRTPIPGHTTESVSKPATAKAAPMIDVAARPETSSHRNLKPPATATPKSPPAKDTRSAKQPTPASARFPQQMASRVRAPAAQAAQTQLANKTPAIQREPPRPRPSATTPRALQASERQSSATPSDTPARRTVATPSPNDSRHPMLGILVLMLVVAVTGGGIWYALGLGDDNSAFEATDTTKVSMLPSHTLENTTPTGSSAPPTASLTPIATQTTPPQTQTPTTDTNKSRARVIAVPTTSTAPGTSANNYHAHIQKKAHELTITLDVPAEDPAFRTPAGKPSAAKTGPGISAKADNLVSTVSSATTATSAFPAKPSKTQHAATRRVEIIHIVVKGDTLWDIAKRYVKDPFRYPELARLSKIKNPDLIYPGERVRIIKHQRQP